MKWASLVLAIGALATGLWASYRWYLSSAVPIELGYEYPGMKAGETYTRNGFTTVRTMESVVPELRQMNEASATWAAMTRAAELNKAAALWTALSVAFAGLSSIAGALSN